MHRDLGIPCGSLSPYRSIRRICRIDSHFFSRKSKSRKTFIFGVTTSTTLELKFHNLSIEIGRLSYKWQ